MIKIENLSKVYSKTYILKNIELEFFDNRLHFIMGSNGCGKTTFLKCLLGLEKYDGTITFEGKGLKSAKPDIFSIFDDVPFYNELSGFQNIKIITGNLKVLNMTQIDDLHLLTNKKLAERVKNYSLGERKKLAFICAVLRKPKYLIIDEISNGLDIETLEIVTEQLAFLKENTLILATGHHLAFYKDIADEILVHHNQTIQQIDYYNNDRQGDLYEVYTRYKSYS